MRGKRIQSVIQFRLIRITPAGAGKTPSEISIRNFWEDHPRRCGENAPFLRRTVRRPGSPPQVRGKLAAFHAAPAARRITPAGAGKTHRGVLRSCRRKDHPRRCGENEMQIITARVSEGSPPQVRGKPERAFYCPLVLGITPAGAGKTFMSRTRGCTAKDHPRRCGENLEYEVAIETGEGSPPQVRGKLRTVSVNSRPTGITPAGAGKTVGASCKRGRA